MFLKTTIPSPVLLGAAHLLLLAARGFSKLANWGESLSDKQRFFLVFPGFALAVAGLFFHHFGWMAAGSIGGMILPTITWANEKILARLVDRLNGLAQTLLPPQFATPSTNLPVFSLYFSNHVSPVPLSPPRLTLATA